MTQEVVAYYTNHRGETGLRRFVPHQLWFGWTVWHPEPQWLIIAWDLEKEALRYYALKGFEGFSGVSD